MSSPSTQHFRKTHCPVYQCATGQSSSSLIRDRQYKKTTSHRLVPKWDGSKMLRQHCLCNTAWLHLSGNRSKPWQLIRTGRAYCIILRFWHETFTHSTILVSRLPSLLVLPAPTACQSATVSSISLPNFAPKFFRNLSILQWFLVTEHCKNGKVKHHPALKYLYGPTESEWNLQICAKQMKSRKENNHHTGL